MTYDDRRLSALPWIASAATLVFHLIANPHYGFFRDELYFIMCGFRPDWGYVDQPPLVPLLSALTQLGGHSLFLLRAVPALFAASAVFVAVALTAELGGGAYARILTAIVVALSPVLASFGGKVGTDEALPFLWTLTAYALLRVVRGADARWSFVAGAALGIGLEMKYSTLFFAVAAVVALLVLPERRVLATRWLFGAFALCAAIALPNALWQAAHGLPMLELLRNAQHGKNVVVSPPAFLGQQLLITGLFLWPVWVAGLVFLARDRSARFLALAWVLLIGAMVALHGKHYYPAAVYPIPFAAGCTALEQWTARVGVVRPFLAAALVAGGLVFVPFVLPVLSEQRYLAYERAVLGALHFQRSATATENHAASVLPSDFADMHGWPELAATVERVVDGLRPGERERAVVVTSNYGEAASLEFFGRGLPPVVSGHNQYFLWGPRGRSGDILIDVNGDCGAAQHLFADAERAATAGTPYAISYERNIPIMVCRGLRVPLPALWPQLKAYI
ncbi:MAG: glycosyltransferase family 39 protein [Candidatus Eremiobacteraeota bacterium]|nr:glycosyltransferase family 39 protein [Candidatus Eremiobacteraeota bacterium]